jgi:hypothetical protein
MKIDFSNATSTDLQRHQNNDFETPNNDRIDKASGAFNTDSFTVGFFYRSILNQRFKLLMLSLSGWIVDIDSISIA